MGEIMFHTGVAGQAIDAVDRLIARVPGRLSLVAVAGGTIFSSLSRLHHRQHRDAGEHSPAGDVPARLSTGDLDRAHRRRRRARHAHPAVRPRGAAREHRPDPDLGPPRRGGDPRPHSRRPLRRLHPRPVLAQPGARAPLRHRRHELARAHRALLQVRAAPHEHLRRHRGEHRRRHRDPDGVRRPRGDGVARRRRPLPAPHVGELPRRDAPDPALHRHDPVHHLRVDHLLPDPRLLGGVDRARQVVLGPTSRRSWSSSGCSRC